MNLKKLLVPFIFIATIAQAGSPAIFNGSFTKLLTSEALLRSDGGKNKFDGARNYINNNHFEVNTTGWSLFNTTLTSGIPTGTVTLTASSLNALARTNTNPLAGTQSLQVSSPGAITAGQGFISTAFTVDRKDLGKMITFQVPYEVVSGGTNADWSGTSTQSMAVYIYDVTGSAWVQPSGFRGMNQSANPGYVTGTFQASVVAGQQYQIAVICLNATAGALTMNFDELYVGPQQQVSGAAISDTTTGFPAFVPNASAFGTITAYTQSTRRVGDVLHAEINFTAGTVAGANATIALPAGYVIDSSKLSTRLNGAAVGNCQASTGSAQQSYANGGCWVFYNGSDTANVYLSSRTAGPTNVFTVDGGSNVSNSSQPMAIKFDIPIAGWSSNVSLSPDALSTPVEASYYIGVATSNTTSVTVPLNFDTKIYDTANAVTVSNTAWRFTAPRTGYYAITMYLSQTASGGEFMSVYKNGVLADGIGTIAANLTQNLYYYGGSYQLKMNAGDYMDIRPSTSAYNSQTFNGLAGTNGTLTASHIEIHGNFSSNMILPSGAITSGASSGYRIESAYIAGNSTDTANCTSASACTVISTSTTNWLNVLKAATGTYTGTIAAGTFTGPPVCNITCGQTTNCYAQIGTGATVPTSTLLPFRTLTGSSTLADGTFHIICMGPH